MTVDRLGAGIYEDLLEPRLLRQLGVLVGDDIDSDTTRTLVRELQNAEAADRLAMHIDKLIRSAVDSLSADDRALAGTELLNKLIKRLNELAPRADLTQEVPIRPRILQAVHDTGPDGSMRRIGAPITPLLDTTLLTNAPGEPQIGAQIRSEFDSAQSIDVVMAFIRISGLNLILENVERHVVRGGRLRVLTTTYTGSTQAEALQRLVDAGAEVRVSYDISGTRLHAKSWIFHRPRELSTAYVGSSNLTHQAQQSGLEWNVRVSERRNPDVLQKICAVFDSYWQSGDFLDFDYTEFQSRLARPASGNVALSPLQIRLEPFQDRLLELIRLARRQGRHRNLLVSATGTGKTVMAAVDYRDLRATLRRSRLLFVAHRKEILHNALATFRYAVRDASFGELWVDGRRPNDFQHVFASVQSLDAAGIDMLDPGHFDVVIIDEFHHAAAPSYMRLLDMLRPIEVLGLTATPERADGTSVADLFGGRISAELRLWDAIDQRFLTPFSYFGIHDDIDLRNIPFKRGRGYDLEKLTELYTSNDAWTRWVIHHVRRHVDDVNQMKALGFCASVSHAMYMAQRFNEFGIPAVAVSGETPAEQRAAALSQLSQGAVSIIFSVDLFNEGIDLPSVDTLLFLRPTDSPVLFIQQLGRGLRADPSKATCLVLDFVGRHATDYRLDRRFRALLGGTRKSLVEQIEAGFPYLPAGCHMELDQIAQELVLENIRNSVPSTLQRQVEELRQLVSLGVEPNLENYLDATGCELTDVYVGQRCWTDLCERAGLEVQAHGPAETALRRAIGRCLHIDDPVRLQFYERLVSGAAPEVESLDGESRRLTRMMVTALAKDTLQETGDLQLAVNVVWNHPSVLAEFRQVCGQLATKIDHVQERVPSLGDTPLLLHARYTRDEVLAALGVGHDKVPPWREGTKWLPDQRLDVHVITLDKTGKQFSPTTRYRDYALSREMLHWESQSTVSGATPTGRRYQSHAEWGVQQLFFARLSTDDRAFWFLGPATYVSHTADRPMAITWRLATSLPGDLFSQFAAAVA